MYEQKNTQDGMRSYGYICRLTSSVTYLRKVKSKLSELAPRGADGRAAASAFAVGLYLYRHSTTFHDSEDVEATEASTDG